MPILQMRKFEVGEAGDLASRRDSEWQSQDAKSHILSGMRCHHLSLAAKPKDWSDYKHTHRPQICA